MNSNRLGLAKLQAVIDRSSFNRWLGMQVLCVDSEKVTLGIRWRDELVSSPERQSIHGGVIAALVDCCADYVIAAQIGRPVPTIDLHIDYHKVAKPGDLTATATITHLGNSMGVASVLVNDAQNQLIASGRGLYWVAVR
jgi:uncharacterized protein (TIGR00369 family)